MSEAVRDAYGSGRSLRLFGAGTWLDAGRPVRADSGLSVADDRGIVEYVPGDLTLTARAGTPLSELVAATKAEGQWLPLDPWGGDGGTIGATVSTATAGPHSYAMGLPRDVVLGLEFVTGKGDVVRSGGRVVKNVAGFDLTRLLIGAWGTLGVITQVTVRLRARPEHTRTVAIQVETTQLALNELATQLRALPFTPLACELVNAAMARQLGAGTPATLIVRIGGNEKSLRGQLDLLRAFGDPRELAADVWEKLRAAEHAGSATWRWSHVPTIFGATWLAAEQATRDQESAFVHGNPMRGVVRLVARDATKAAQTATDFHGTIAIERLPESAWPLVKSRPAGDSVSRAIREKFDPGGILNPGILGAIS